MESYIKFCVSVFLFSGLFERLVGTISSFNDLDALVKSGKLLHPPWFTTKRPINITLDIHLAELRDVDPERLEIELGYFRHLRWTDERLKFDSRLTMMNLSYIPWEPAFKKTVWTPDVHVTNAVQSWLHSPEPDMIYRLDPNGTIWESLLLSSTLICKKAPIYPKIEFDCVMRFESYGYTRKELSLDWKAKNPHSLIDFFSSPTFRIKNIKLKETCEDRRSIGLYDCIEFRLMVYQEYQPFITEIFVPSSLIVLAAWLTFWIDKDSIPARVSLGGLCVIASITHSVGLVLGLRHNIEWHSVNIWLHTCIVFVVFALVEYGIVHSLVRRVHKKARTNFERLNSDSSTSYQAGRRDIKIEAGNGYQPLHNVTGDTYGGSSESLDSVASRSPRRCIFSRLRRIFIKIRTNPGKIDTIMRVFYPTLFAVFVICYWIHFTKND